MSWPGWELTNPPTRSPEVAAVKEALFNQLTWAREWPGFQASHDTTPDAYDAATRDVIAEYQRRTGMVAAGTAVAGICNTATEFRLGVTRPPAPERHACLTFRGTGGVIGQDYTSLVAQACSQRVEEIPVPTPAAMGPVPVGTASDPHAPSGEQCVDAMLEWAVQWVEDHAGRTLLIGGYSLGAIAATRLRMEFLPGGRLEKFAHNYIAGYTFGNPARAFGHTFYLGAIPNGEGIADIHLPAAACTWDWCDEADQLDIYTNVPPNQTGQIMRDVYKDVMALQINDPVALAQAMIPRLLDTVKDAGVNLPFPDLGGIVSGVLAGLVLGLLGNALPGVASDSRAAAAVQAAILGIRFAADNPPTRPHITYQDEAAMPGQSHLAHAIQHVNDWASRVPVR